MASWVINQQPTVSWSELDPAEASNCSRRVKLVYFQQNVFSSARGPVPERFREPPVFLI